jgi:ankyrin repeat protein
MKYRLRTLFVGLIIAGVACAVVRHYIERERARGLLMVIVKRGGTDVLASESTVQEIINHFPALAATDGLTVWAMRHGRTDTVTMILRSGGNPNDRGDWFREPPLFWAVVRNDTVSVRILLEHGADPNCYESVNGYPSGLLALACNCGSTEVAKLLRESGAEINPGVEGSDSPLHEAVASGNVELVQYLLREGANPKIRNVRGLLPHEHALISVHLATSLGNAERAVELQRIHDEIVDYTNKEAHQELRPID